MMKTANDYLNELKARYGWKNDSEIARQLDTHHTAIVHLRVGRRAFSDEQALRVAELLEVPKEEVLAAALVQREKNPAVRAVWESIAKKIGRVATEPALAQR